jgi:hypothetical protein
MTGKNEAFLLVIVFIICGAKVFGQMSNCVGPYCRRLNQSNFFLLERAMSELQFLYQVYFSRTNLRRKKSPKPNTSKKGLATFLEIEKFVFLNCFELHRPDFNKKDSKM